MNLKRNTVDGEIQIRDRDTDNNDIVAIVPLTGDDEDTTYDDEVLAPFADLICDAPQMAATLNAIANDCERWSNGDFPDITALIRGINHAACEFAQHFTSEVEDEDEDDDGE